MSKQKVVIITGADHGIGAEIAHYLLERNYRVVVADLHLKHKHTFPKDDERVLFVKTDVSKEVSVRNMFTKTIRHFGQVDALVNNAGLLFGEKRTPFEKITLKEWYATIETNLTGTFLCSKYAVPHLRKQKGSIVNISSTRAFQSEENTEPYSASKGGIVALTHATAISLGPDIRVNCISPGWIHTNEKEKLKPKDHEQHPVGRVGKPEDIASIVAFLISEEASFITGQNFIVDGGMSRKMIYH